MARHCRERPYGAGRVSDLDHIQNNGLDLSSEVEITAKDGTTHVYRTNEPRGEPENPMSTEELSAKFNDCTLGSLSAMEVQEIQRKVKGLESVSDVSALLAIAVGPPTGKS